MLSSTSYEKHPFVTAVSQRSDILSEEGVERRWDFCDQGWSYAAVLICTTTFRAGKRKLEPILFKGKEFILFYFFYFLSQLPFTSHKAFNSHKTHPKGSNKET